MKPYVSASLLALAVGAIVVFYGYTRCSNELFISAFDPVLRTSIGTGPWEVNGWSITHTIAFAIISYFYPDDKSSAYLFALGIAWEAVEYTLSKKSSLGVKCKGKMMVEDTTTTTTNTTGDEYHNGRWWYMDPKDICFNLLGIFIGRKLRQGWMVVNNKLT